VTEVEILVALVSYKYRNDVAYLIMWSDGSIFFFKMILFYSWEPVSYPKQQNNFHVDRMNG
jgi:hypothetical protein